MDTTPDRQIADPAGALGVRLRAGHALQQSPRRAYALLRSAIRDGGVPVLGRLAEDALVRDLATSRNAVRLALHKLGLDGLVERRPKTGTVVVSKIGRYPIFECADPTTGVTVNLSLIETRDVPATAYLAQRFEDEGLESLRMSEFVLTSGDRTVGIFSRYGLVAAPALEQAAPTLLPDEISWYRRIHREPPGPIEVTIEAVGADERTARLLGVEEGHPLLVRETLYRDRLERPAELHYTFLDSRMTSLHARSSAG
ncbi:GntR family transcriptional regulator [Actinoplanes sp. RD1]|uniref:GntR family transcriptional regulator n=1 Tax=Actinoplanes sp. RD1 TaxID=3064538 RepID=UPI002740A16C|nr:GntR family transcriptional regulator [Actinoplanes sp. RD1]